jgi:hypothetical protein
MFILESKYQAVLFIRFMYKYLRIFCILVIRHPVDGHRSERNVLVKNNNKWLQVFMKFFFVFFYLCLLYLLHVFVIIVCHICLFVIYICLLYMFVRYICLKSHSSFLTWIYPREFYFEYYITFLLYVYIKK